MAEHRKDYKRFKTGATTVVCSSFKLLDEYGIDNCKIELVEAYPCENKEELRKREGYWIKLEECVNKTVAGRTQREYYVDNRLKLLENNKEYMKTYYIENRDKILTRNSIYKKLDKYKEQQKEYREATKQERQEYDRLYHEIHKEQIRARRQEKHYVLYVIPLSENVIPHVTRKAKNISPHLRTINNII
jgi:hypothetical protein